MKVYKIVWDVKALNDIQAIWDYIAKDSLRAANKVSENIRKASKTIKTNPLIGVEETLLKKYNRGYRYIVYSHYKIIYRADTDQILIITVFDTRQNPEKLRKSIKLRKVIFVKQTQSI